MPFQQAGDIRFYTFASLSVFPEIFHAVLTRCGGSSPAPWASLNLGGTVGDDPETVLRNKCVALQAVQRDAEMVFDVWQVHGKEFVRAIGPRQKYEPQKMADIIISDKPHLTIMMRFADCVPILLYDPVHKAVGLAHAGWQGTVQKVADAAVKAMQREFNTHPGQLCAAIGPSIGPDHYQVGEDVISRVQSVFGLDADILLPSSTGRVSFDLWAANRLLLEQAGVSKIELAEICTACHLDDWFSHRGEKGRTGRFGVMIGLQ